MMTKKMWVKKRKEFAMAERHFPRLLDCGACFGINQTLVAV